MEAVIHQFKLVSEGFIRLPASFIVRRIGARRAWLLPCERRKQSPLSAACALSLFPPCGGAEKSTAGHILSDVIVAIASVDPILGDVDRDDK